ncbi:hypothetical protein [Microbacterium rhizophilus]|uniref:hypothetical protein n=1 Tax=Microbacterium rhizophilus TaxID=3138934 RepID=UPI0031EB7F0E
MSQNSGQTPTTPSTDDAPAVTPATVAHSTSTPPAAAEAAADAAESQDATPETGGSYLTEPNVAQQKVAEGLRQAGEKVEALAPNDGVAKDLADKASAGLKHASEWVSEQDAGAALTEAKSFVRRKPWVAAGIAVGALLVLNRITRALTGGKK